MRKAVFLISCFILLIGAVLFFTTFAGQNQESALKVPTYDIVDAQHKKVGEYVIPRDEDIVKEKNAEEIIQGKLLFSETKRMLPQYVTANLNCTSCHLSGGKVVDGLSFINSINSYPSYNARAGKDISLAQRINGCFLRSMNGKEIPADGPEMKAMIAYMGWLAKGVEPPNKVKINFGSLDNKLEPNSENGQKLYQVYCASCHGKNGEGIKDSSNQYLLPPLWGNDSFNIGAGMARTYTAAKFIKYGMPLAHNKNYPLGQGGVLTDQEAIDIADYFSHMPRPDFADKYKDWPNGGKPKDARY